MNLFTAENISKCFTDRILFDGINFGIQEGDKIGVLGINGTGKSTLLKIIAGIEETDKGTITRGKKVRIAYLSQTPIFSSSLTILENVLEGKKAEEDYRNLEGEAKAMLLKLGLTDTNASPEYLSGGQKKRAALVKTLLTPAEILVLDEPTNHLDSEMAEWLEEYLKKYTGALIMVTHDRYFLDKVTNKIFELDKGKLYSYTANYSKFIELKSLREEMEQATERKNKSLYRIEYEWIMRGARARSTKQKAHIQRFEKLRDRERLEEEKKVEISSISSRLGKKTIELNSVSKSFPEKTLFKNFSYIFLPTDRIGIVGRNGCGKTSLLKIITGNLQPDSGIIEIGQTVKIAYFSQENEYMNDNQKVIDYIKEIAEYIETIDGIVTASSMLERFLFTGALQYSLIGKLSGGEKRRLYLLKILMQAPNVLILDEPTNDLDITTLTILENYLEGFDGIVITVSHDRYFLDKIVNRIFAFEEDGVIRQYEGNYSDYKEKIKEKDNIQKTETKEKTGNTWKKRDVNIPKFTYTERKEYETIEEDISEIEQKLSELETEMEKYSADYTRLNQILQEKEDLEKELEYKMERWEYLTDLADKIQQYKQK